MAAGRWVPRSDCGTTLTLTRVAVVLDVIDASRGRAGGRCGAPCPSGKRAWPAAGRRCSPRPVTTCGRSGHGTPDSTRCPLPWRRAFAGRWSGPGRGWCAPPARPAGRAHTACGAHAYAEISGPGAPCARLAYPGRRGARAQGQRGRDRGVEAGPPAVSRPTRLVAVSSYFSSRSCFTCSAAAARVRRAMSRPPAWAHDLAHDPTGSQLPVSRTLPGRTRQSCGGCQAAAPWLPPVWWAGKPVTGPGAPRRAGTTRAGLKRRRG